MTNRFPNSLTIIFLITVISVSLLVSAGAQDLGKFPQTIISNDFVTMKLYLPDKEKGLYRATRFDWSGVIASLQYKGHEYFGYWKDTHDPTVHEDLTGPVESYNKPGLGYEEAKPGEKFIRIGVGILEKPDEKEYQAFKTYPFVDHGKWEVSSGKDWIEFKHRIDSDFGYAYIYTKRIELIKNKPGFVIHHALENTGDKTIETDQYNHNFFMIDGEESGPNLEVSFPYSISTEEDLQDLMAIRNDKLVFLRDLENDRIWMELSGFRNKSEDHQFTMRNKKTGAGVHVSMDRPLHRMVFWACRTTFCPENFIWISVAPGESFSWSLNYELFLEEE